MNIATPIPAKSAKSTVRLGHTACPHDCPSTCALEVEISEDGRIGRVRGANDHSYTSGVICAKVARYAERLYHPDRLMHPLRRTGAKGAGRVAADLLGRCAGRNRRSVRQSRSQGRQRSDLALLLRRHHGLGSARLDRSPASRQALLRFLLVDLHQSGLDRLHHGDWHTARPRSARDGPQPIAW